MIKDKGIWDEEIRYLKRVIDEIKLQLENGEKALSNIKKEAIDMQKNMWEDVRCAPADLFDLEDSTTIWQYQTDLSNKARSYKFSYEMVERLRRMYQSPYFGRIDFIEEGEEKAEKIYIGIHNLTASGTREILVYDWRAPISSMFYDFEIGLCSYECPVGIIRGQMLLKRQYKIENQNIVYMFDSSLSINDEMLREILGKSTDSRMKTIVTSIQREQNTVIRNSQDKILVVEGPAGCGKTSIALHRAAYLLYKYRDSIKSENILVFSPNHVFEDYISNVLPELEEENIQRSTFADFFGKKIEGSYRVESMNEQMEYILSDCCKKIRLDSIKLKSSLQFLNILKRYKYHLENGMGVEFKDLFYNGNLLITSDEIYHLLRNEYNYFSYSKRLEKLRLRLFYLLEQSEEKRVREAMENDLKENNSISEREKIYKEQKLKMEYEWLKNDIIQRTSFDIYRIYMDLFNNIELFANSSDKEEIENLHIISSYTLSRLEKNILDYEDLAPLIYLKSVLDPDNDKKSIKHVIIDEAQDYTAVHFEIFKQNFEHCNMTILGDINQSLNGYMNIGSFDIISDIYDKKDAKNIKLTKSYRSSKEIADFCNGILKNNNPSEQLNRHGNKPQIIKVDKNDLPKRIADDIERLKSMNCKLIAVICKTAWQCEALYKSISSYMDISLISNQNEIYKGGTVIIPSYLAKGLEFDAVLVNSIDDEDYSKEEDRRLLYTVCTRALHELYLYYSDVFSRLIKDLDENLYISKKA